MNIAFQPLRSQSLELGEALQRLKQAGFWIIIQDGTHLSYYRTVGMYQPEVNSPEAVRALPGTPPDSYLMKSGTR